jgi:uncharacterized protein YodC (DUF2158 family)
MSTFAVGDVVQLKSGGPQMTISKIDGDNSTYKCCWFNGKKVEWASLPLETMVSANETTDYDGIEDYGY